MEEVPTYHRASKVYSHATFPSGGKWSQYVNAAPGSDSLCRIWDLSDFQLFIESKERDPILSCFCKYDKKASLSTISTITRSREHCLTNLITDGSIYSINGGLGDNRFFMTNNTTIYDLPEALYDLDHQNDQLPYKVDGRGRIYYQNLSPFQIPKERYTDIARSFYSTCILDIGEEVESKGSNAYNRRQRVRISYMGYVGDLPRNEDPSVTQELIKSLEDMNTSTCASKRMSSKFITDDPHTAVYAHKNIQSGQNSNLMPAPISQCSDTTLCKKFMSCFGESLGSYCSYAYLDDQFECFEYGTNHVAKGRLVGGMVGALCLKDKEKPTRSDFLSHPIIEVTSEIDIAMLAFASLYSPLDERWKKYSVCTSPFVGCSRPGYKQVPISLDSNTFVCKLDDGKKLSPYCVFQVPFSVDCSNVIPSYVRYLPKEDGTMVDVYSQEYQVFITVKMFANFRCNVNDMAVTDVNLPLARLLLGNPMYSGENLSKGSFLEINTYYGVLDDDGIVALWKEVPHEQGDNSTTFINNDFSYLKEFSCTATDIKVQINRSGCEDGPEPNEFDLMVVEPQEAVHKQ